MSVWHMYGLLRMRYPWCFLYSFINIKSNKIVFQILLQDKYNIGVLTVNIECMWLGTKRMERIAGVRLYPVSKPHKFYINRQCTNTVYIFAFEKIVFLCEQSFVFYFQIEIVLLISCVMYIPY